MAIKYPKTIPTQWRLRYSRAQAQAKYREEAWQFDIHTWYQLWQDSGVMHRIGSRLEAVNMTRIDNQGAWSRENCIIVSRRVQMHKLGKDNFGKMGPTQFDLTQALYVPEEVKDV